MKSLFTGLGVVGVIILFILAIVFGPLAIAWSLNTLFPVLAIPYTFWSWLAIVVLNLSWFYKGQFKKG